MGILRFLCAASVGLFLNFHPIFGDFLRHSRTLIDRIYFIYIYIFFFKEMLSVTYVFLLHGFIFLSNGSLSVYVSFYLIQVRITVSQYT